MNNVNLFEGEIFSRKEAIEYLKIPEKNFDNYFKYSKEIHSKKLRNRWRFNKTDLDKWKSLKESRTVTLSMNEYKKCFEFAMRIVYSGVSSHGTGIRGFRSEVQQVDDFILGILGEYGVKKFLKDNFNFLVELDMNVHIEHITPQDIISYRKYNRFIEPKLGIAIKASKIKNCFNIIPPIEYENDNRKSDIYIFARVDLPSDHLFRIVKRNSFFKDITTILEEDEKSKKIGNLINIPVWICGFNYHKELDKVNSVPGQEFGGNPPHRYVKSVSEMLNSDKDWQKLINKL